MSDTIKDLIYKHHGLIITDEESGKNCCDFATVERVAAEREAQAVQREREAAKDKIEYLERLLHETLHNIPKASKDCKNFCYLTFTRYEDGTYGHSCTASLDPAEAMMAVYGNWAVKQEVLKVLDLALATYNDNRKG